MLRHDTPRLPPPCHAAMIFRRCHFQRHERDSAMCRRCRAFVPFTRHAIVFRHDGATRYFFFFRFSLYAAGMLPLLLRHAATRHAPADAIYAALMHAATRCHAHLRHDYAATP